MNTFALKKKYGTYAIAALGLMVVLLIMAPQMKASPLLGNRSMVPPLTPDDTVQHVLYKNTKNNKYFLRLILPRPKQRYGLVLVAHESYPFKSVQVIARATSVRGKNVVVGRKLEFVQVTPSPWREYVVTWPQLQRAYKGTDDFVMNFEWISFDIEVDFPVSAPPTEQRQYLRMLTYSGGLLGLELQNIDVIQSASSAAFEDSLNAIVPK